MKDNCHICKKNFLSKSALNRHLRSIHKMLIEITPRTSHVCPIKDCTFTSTTAPELRVHLKTVHFYELNEKTEFFESVQDFSIWKENFEKSNKIYFKKGRGDAKCTDYTSQYFICNRSGTYSSQSKGKRCARDSAKTGMICPAYLKVAICNATGKVKVNVMNTHLGHTNELKYLRLPESLRVNIASQIKSGINEEKILEFVRNTIDVSYNHLLTRKYINNIQKSFGLKDIERHSDDVISHSNQDTMNTDFSQETDCNTGRTTDEIFPIIINSISIQEELDKEQKRKKAQELLHTLSNLVEQSNSSDNLTELNKNLYKMCQFMEIKNNTKVTSTLPKQSNIPKNKRIIPIGSFQSTRKKLKTKSKVTKLKVNEIVTMERHFLEEFATTPSKNLQNLQIADHNYC